MGLDTTINKITGFQLSMNEFNIFYEEYIKVNKIKTDFSIYDYAELIEENTNWHYDIQHDDPSYGCYYDSPSIIIYNSSKDNQYYFDYFSIDGKNPVKKCPDKNCIDILSEYVLDSNETGYGFNAPECLDLELYGYPSKNISTEKYNDLKNKLNKLCIDLDDFRYSSFIMTFYF